MAATFGNFELFNRQAPQWLITGVRAHVLRGEMAGAARVNLEIGRTELVQVFVEVIVPSVDDCG
jgi:hypothetical protein